MALPVQKTHLKESGLGKLAVSMAADPAETRENQELVKQVRLGRLARGEELDDALF